METDFSNGGGVKIGDSATACDGTIAGAIRYNDAGADTLDYCNGVSWLTLLSSAVTGILDGGNATGAAITIGTNDNFALNFETNNVNRMIIDNTGNVGIGTTTTTDKLHLQTAGYTSLRVESGGSSNAALALDSGSGRIYSIQSTGSASGQGNNKLYIWDHTANANRFTIDSSGNVGIGTPSPAVALDVNTGTVNAASICDENNANCLDLSAGVSGGDPSYGSSASSPNDAVYVNDSGFVGIGTTAPAADLDVAGVIRADMTTFSEPANAGTTDAAGDKLIVWESATHRMTAGMSANGMYLQNTGGSNTDGMRFFTGSSTPVERMRITRDGAFGFGTTNPARPFHFSGADTSGNGIMALVENTASTGEPYSGFVFNTAGSTDGFLFAGKNTSLSFGIVPGITFRTGNNTQDIGFATGNASSGGASGPAMVIKPSGFVGIGTVTPDAALDVNTGSINAAQICDENNANCLDLSAGVSGGDPSYGSSASSPNDAVFVDDSGSVGVGTTAPRSKLHLGNNVSDVDTANQIRLYDGGGASGAVYGLGISALDFDLFSQSNYRFHVGSLENDRGSEVLTILSNGNIGIGSTSPGNILDIVSSGLDDGVRITNSNASSWASFYAINNLGNEVNFGIGGSSAPTVPNTAYFYAVNNTDFAIGTNNTTRMTVTSAGNVGIGTSVPAVELDVDVGTINAASICDENNANCLDLSAGVSGGDPSYGSSASSPNDAVYVNDSGFVGIGTASPAEELHVYKNEDAAAEIRIENPNVGVSGRSNLRLSNDVSNGGVAYWGTGTANSRDLQLYNNDVLGSILFYLDGQNRAAFNSSGHLGVGTVSPQRPLHISDTTNPTILIEDPSAGADLKKRYISSIGGTLSFGKFNDAVTVPTDHMAIDSAGNVGIGTSAPSGEFHVLGNGTDAYFESNGTNGVGLHLVSSDTGGHDYELFSSASGNSIGAGKFTIHDITAATTRLLIDDNGLVGIGTTTPAVELDVNTGSINAAEICDENNANCLDLSTGLGGGGGDPSYGSSASSPNDAVYVNDSGNVGIGTTTPSENLVVGTDLGANYTGNRIVVGGANAPGIVMGEDAANRSWLLWDEVRNSFYMGNYQAGTLNNNVFVMNGNNIGINTPTPDEMLHIDAGIGTSASIKISSRSGVGNSYLTSWYDAGDTSQKTSLGSGTFSDILTYNNVTGHVGIGTTVPLAELDVDGTGALVVPRGTSLEQPGTPANGMIRYNTDSNKFEAYEGGTWANMIGGGAADNLGDHIMDANLQTNGNWISGDGGNEGIFIDAAGNIGVNTSSTVAGRFIIDSKELRVLQQGAGVTPLSMVSAYTDTGYPEFIGARSRGNSGPWTAVADGDTMVNWVGRAYNGAAWEEGAQIEFNVDGTNVTGAGNHTGGRIDFVTRGTTNTGQYNISNQVMTIRNNGFVGIGTSDPSDPLAVESADPGAVASFYNNGSNDSYISILGAGGRSATVSLRSTDGTGRNRWKVEKDGITETGSNAGSNFQIESYDDSGTSLGIPFFIERATQYVGINTTAPVVELDVDTGVINAASICDENNANCLDLSAGVGGGGDPSYGSSASSPNDAVYVNDSGNVGIGTTTAAEKLHLSGSNNIGLRLSGLVNNSMTYIEFTENNNIDGMRIEYDGSNGINEMNIKNYNSGAKIMTIERAGNVGIGTDAPDVELDVHTGSINAASICDENNANCLDLSAGVSGDNLGNHTATQALDMATFDINNAGTVNAVDFVLTSDRRFKENIETLENALEKIMQVRGVSYFWNLDDYPNSGFTEDKQLGLIAQEIQKIFPEVVEEVNGHLAVKYTALVPVLIEATKAQQREISSLRQEVDDLKQQMKVQQEQIEFLMKKLKD